MGVAVLLAVAACSSPPGGGSDGASSAEALSSRAGAAIASATAAAASLGPVPSFDHVVVAVMENKDVEQVLGSGQAPFIDQLAQSGVYFTNAHAVAHPSQPNYLALFSGATQGVTTDVCLPPVGAPNLR